MTLMAVAFGLTVVITRLYLMASGYPKIGGKTYHIAHALFGGLLLVIACLVMFLFASRAALTTAALLSGIGLGLFIDEVGKFITSDNDYFFPLAAPIIYLAFLLIVLVARYAARSRVRPPALVLADVTTQVGMDLGAPISVEQRNTLLHSIDTVDRGGFSPDTVALCDALGTYLRTTHERAESSRFARLRHTYRRVEDALLPQRALAAVLIAVLIGHAVWTLLRLVLALIVISGWRSPSTALNHFLDVTQNHGWKALVGLGIAAVAEVLVGVGCAVAAVAWIRGRADIGVRLGIWSSIISLTLVNVLASYFSQFLTVFTAIAEALLLWLLIRYRTRYCSV
ncbi:hypothetical protein GPX89_29635 [Nocardia sp. ET3-3]|uniref:Uncharacterized protein n=1 Tax=Nocardia terrae TaxID=2675851 RepID=A0A7K1V424_9NOCA|nr:hypothetical protein [Nocardia terrae]MVU81393.1 hypothetical protein [Nocardia terrae]